MEASWRLLEALGGILEALGGILEPTWTVLEPLGRVLEKLKRRSRGPSLVDGSKAGCRGGAMGLGFIISD